MKRKNIVGNNIREVRLQKGLTQEALALECGLSQGYINQLENGKRLYTQKSLEVIAKALDTPTIEFFKEKEIAMGNIEKVTSDKKPSKKELISLLNDLPDHVVEHYLTLLKMESKLLKKSKS